MEVWRGLDLPFFAQSSGIALASESRPEMRYSRSPPGFTSQRERTECIERLFYYLMCLKHMSMG